METALLLVRAVETISCNVFEICNAHVCFFSIFACGIVGTLKMRIKVLRLDEEISAQTEISKGNMAIIQDRFTASGNHPRKQEKL